MYRQAAYDDDLYRRSRPGAAGYVPPARFEDAPPLPSALSREVPPDLPELSEQDVMRHFLRLSHMNYGVDTGMYPLGSCTMKYNPKLHEVLANVPLLTMHHPEDPPFFVQGTLALMWHLSELLKDLSGTQAVTLQPAAGAQAEYLGVRIIMASHAEAGGGRDEMIVPDTAHGTNPASSAMGGCRVVELPSRDDGRVDVDALAAIVSTRTAGLMLTNPNTLGIFERDIHEIAGIVHDAGGLLYYDGANLNALVGRARPGDMGFDVVHFNFHKTFSTPHGGGGPGAGAIGVTKALEPYLPVPRLVRDGYTFSWSHDAPRSIGQVRAYYGNVGVMVRAYAYLYANHGRMHEISGQAVLNAMYLLHRLKSHFEVPYYDDAPLRMHEFVISCAALKKETGCGAADVARRLLDYGIHAPTVHFPLVVKEALMIEPTETESKGELDAFASALIEIKKECYEDPETVRSAPHVASRRQLDILAAAKRPVLSRMHERG